MRAPSMIDRASVKLNPLNEARLCLDEARDALGRGNVYEAQEYALNAAEWAQIAIDREASKRTGTLS